jgi:preprotein translocase subunit YajC
MDTGTQETLMGIAFFLSIFGIFYIYLTTRNRERMAMIEKGADPSLFKRRPTSNWAIKFGMFLVGAALGILMGNVLDATTKIEEEVAYFSMIFLFSGLSLVIYYLFIERKETNRS